MRLLLATLLLLVPATTLAAWPPQGVRVTGLPGEEFVPEVVSDGTGGAFVSWTHLVPGTVNYEAFLQRLAPAGEIAPGWPTDGLLVAGGPNGQGPAALAPDGAGGVLILVSSTAMDPQGDLYLQRITAAGTVAPGWPAAGVPVVTAPGTQSDVSMASDGEGGAWVSWYDRRDPNQDAGYLSHVLSDGTLAPGWPPDGREFEPYSLIVGQPLLLPLEDGGFLACWGFVDDPNFVASGLRGQRYDASGNPSPDWPAGGVVARVPVAHSGPPRGIAPDGTGGFFAVWEDYRNWSAYSDEVDVYAQHIRGDGTRAPGWPEDGLAVSALPGVTQQAVTLCEDGRGGVYIAWDDYRAGYVQVYGQHLAGDGTPYPGWPVGGKPLTGLPTWQLQPQLVWDGADGAYLSWMSFGAGGYRTYVSKLTPYGTPAPGWAPDGVSVSILGGDQYEPFIASDGQGGAIVAWETGDIYAQRFVRDGIVAGSVSLVSAEATPAEVRLRWRVSGANRASVERREGEGAWTMRATLDADGEGYVAYADTEVIPGTGYEYRLAFADGTHGGLAAVAVPLAYALALEGPRPNPARGALQVAFTLPDAAPAQFALYDLAGRRVAAREVGERGAGRHLVRLDDALLAPGLYWAALTHGGRVLRTRVVVAR